MFVNCSCPRPHCATRTAGEISYRPEEVSSLVDLVHDVDLDRTGGFLYVDVKVANESRRPAIAFTFYDADGGSKLS